MTESLGSNPFATRYTRPGMVEFLFPPGQSAEGLVEKLRQQNWWGAILGPHGAGKSTLIHTLRGALEAAGRRPVLLTLHQNQRKLAISREQLADWSAATQVVVDGYEQLGWWGRWRLKSLCRKHGAGLLVTAHQPIGIVELLHVQPSLETTQRVVEQLLRHSSAQDAGATESQKNASPTSNLSAAQRVISDEDVAEAFARQQGNVRETLFELHDLYRRRIAATHLRPC